MMVSYSAICILCLYVQEGFW